MAKEHEILVSESERPSRGPSGTFMMAGYPTELTTRAISATLTYLYGAGTNLPTVYVNDAPQKLEAIYGDTGLSLEFVVVEQALRVKLKQGRSNTLIVPSMREAMAFLCELEGHRQGTCTPLMKHPNRYAVKNRTD